MRFSQDASFAPITIVLETAEEAEALYILCNHSSAIPNDTYLEGESKQASEKISWQIYSFLKNKVRNQS